MPDKSIVTKFKNHNHSIRVPSVVYAYLSFYLSAK